MELLVSEKEICRGCGNEECGDSEVNLATDGARFLMCSGCGLQAYCSVEVRKPSAAVWNCACSHPCWGWIFSARRRIGATTSENASS